MKIRTIRSEFYEALLKTEGGDGKLTAQHAPIDDNINRMSIEVLLNDETYNLSPVNPTYQNDEELIYFSVKSDLRYKGVIVNDIKFNIKQYWIKTEDDEYTRYLLKIDENKNEKYELEPLECSNRTIRSQSVKSTDIKGIFIEMHKMLT